MYEIFSNMKNLIYLNPDDVDITEPPTIVKSRKNSDVSRFDEYVEIPEVDIEDVIAKNTLAIP